MRRVKVLIAALALVVLTQGPATGAPAPDTAPDQARAIAPIEAIPADSVVDGYGVGIHLYHLNTPYRDADAVATALRELGVRHVRDDLYLDAPRQYAAIGTVARDAGVKFDLILGRPGGAATPTDYVDTVAGLPAGAVESVEGVNEWDLFGGGESWVAELTGWQRGIWDAARANPATASLPVLSPALAFRWNYDAVGDLTPYADVANAHMYPGGHRPSNEITRITQALLGMVSGRPVVTTEAGYHNAMAADGSHPGVPEDVAGAYLPRLLLEHLARGEQRMYGYELIDSFDDPELTDPEAHFGLLRHDLTPKPAYTSMQALLALLADPGPAFTARSLAISADGFPHDARFLLTQKRNGTFVLLLWRDVSLYDPVQKQYHSVTPDDVTVRLEVPADLTVHRPSDPATPPTSTRGTSLPLALDGHVTAVTVVPAVAPGAPRSLKVKAGRKRVIVSWIRPRPNGRPITSYRVTVQGRTVSVGPERHRVKIKGLSPDRRKRVTVRAQNDIGWGRAATRVLPAGGH
jgi:hypothetical protein